jgi:aerobic carbon-monoxide dehydrogenase medium subunit
VQKYAFRALKVANGSTRLCDLRQRRKTGIHMGGSRMIPGTFDYHRPKTVAEATKLMSKMKGARALAGGHSLLPMMKLRMAEPKALVDLGGIKTLKGIKKVGKNIVIGATTTQHELLGSALVAKHLPILHEVAVLIADPQVRYMGTVGGNVANGDPGNDLPAVMMALDATYVLTGTKSRKVNARAFYKGAYETVKKDSELLTAIEIPALTAHGYAYEKLKRKVGDYATAAAAVLVTTKGGKIATVEITLTNLGPTPLRAEAAAKALVGASANDEAAIQAAVVASKKIMDPANDTRGTPEYRTSVGGIMVHRAIKRALAKA